MICKAIRPPVGAGATAAIALAALLAAAPFPALATSQEQLLTKAEVEEILGVDVVVGDRGEGHSFTSSDPTGSVTIDDTPAAAARMLKGRNETVEDLGDDAFFMLEMPMTVVLVVIAGDAAFTLSVSFPLGKPEAVTDLKGTAKKLAEKALARL